MAAFTLAPAPAPGRTSPLQAPRQSAQNPSPAATLAWHHQANGRRPQSSKGARPATSLRRGGLQHQLLNGPLPPSPSRAAICPVRLPSRQAVQRRRCELRRGGAVRATLLTPALIPVITKALLSAGAVAWSTMLSALAPSHRLLEPSRRKQAHVKLRSLCATLAELFSFSPTRLSLQYLHGTSEMGSLEDRRYTITHCDRTGMLQVSIGRDYHAPQFSGWYKRLLRDEVLAEWRGGAAAAIINSSAGIADAVGGEGGLMAVPSLHIYCHISAAIEVAGAFARIPWPPAPPTLRALVFQKDMPIVLAALAYSERRLLEASPLMAAAPVYLHLRCHLPELDRVVHWGRFGDPASWRPHTPPPARTPAPARAVATE